MLHDRGHSADLGHAMPFFEVQWHALVCLHKQCEVPQSHCKLLLAVRFTWWSVL